MRGRAVKSLGIDLASDPRKTGLCVVEWEAGKARVAALRVGADDGELLEAQGRVDATGIDAPFGWPVPFVELVACRGMAPAKPWTDQTKRELRFRLTDVRVRELTGLWPLSVSTDLIGVPALRCAGLLTQMGVSDRSGDGLVYEVYPAAALKMWRLPFAGYKGIKKRRALEELCSALLRRAPWLRITDEEHIKLLRSRDDAFDALVAALVARAASLGLTAAPSSADRPRAEIEGWIHVPLEGSLQSLEGRGGA